MNYKFLHKVLDQLVSETEIDGSEVIRFPFLSSLTSSSLFSHFFLSSFPLSLFLSFSKHCRNIYGLNKEEIEYVWEEYKQIIKDKIRNNGL